METSGHGNLTSGGGNGQRNLTSGGGNGQRNLTSGYDTQAELSGPETADSR